MFSDGWKLTTITTITTEIQGASPVMGLYCDGVTGQHSAISGRTMKQPEKPDLPKCCH
jgi:hypothetical protein